MVTTNITLPRSTWKYVFGNSQGRTIEDRAKSSCRTFVRSMDHLAFDSANASGQKLSAYEVLRYFGENKIAEILEHGTAILVSDSPRLSSQPGKRIKARRTELGLTPKDISEKVGISKDELAQLEEGSSRVPARILTKICAALSLDEYRIGFEDPSPKVSNLGVRFRQLQVDRDHRGGRLDKSSALSLLEDAWIISKQNELLRSLGNKYEFRSEVSPTPDYGDPQNPAWKIGYELASETRRALDLDPDEPIENLRVLLESRLHIPLIQDELHRNIAGATLQWGDDRGIVLNTSGRYFNTWSARLTIAHELGHLLWDPDTKLNSLVVDTDDHLSEAPWKDIPEVEQRANAFAIEFLFPREAISRRFAGQYQPPNDIFDFMQEFGVSFTAARYHIWNATHRIWELEDLRTSQVEPTEDWEAREQFLTTIMPSRELEDAEFAMNRRGQFLSVVVDARRQRLISDDTAALYLGVDVSLLDHVDKMRNMFFD